MAEWLECLSLSLALNYFGTLIAGHLHVIDSGCSIEVQFCYVFLNESQPCYEFTNVSELLDFMMMNFPIKISLFCFLSGWIHLSLQRHLSIYIFCLPKRKTWYLT